jgi:hypothetical protein
MAQEPYISAKLAATLADGRIIDVALKNFGWDWKTNSYVTQFEFEDMAIVSYFSTSFHQLQHCSEPDVRLCRDCENLEAALKTHCGAALCDLEEA